MPTKTLLALLITVAICVPVLASTPVDPDPVLSNATYTFHENLHEGQKIPVSVTYTYKNKSTATTNGQPTVTDIQATQSWKVSLTVQAVKDGSATQTQVVVDPDSFDTNTTAGQDAVKTPCAFAGKTVTLTRHDDESITDDSKLNIGNPDDFSTLDGFIIPDSDYYPDKPVAVGDTWDVSDKCAKHAGLGPKDQLKAVCHLDWVRTIDGKQMAQISCSEAVISQEDGNVEEDQQSKITLDVDIAAGMIVKYDQTGSSKYSTPPTEPTQVAGGTEFTYHGEVAPDQPATQP